MTQFTLIPNGPEKARAENIHEVIDNLFMERNKDGLNFLEQIYFILFEKYDERFLLEVLRTVPNIDKYLYITSHEG